MIESIVDHLSKAISEEMPGEEAHVQMAPIQRPLPSEARKWKDTKFAGVLVLLYPLDGRIHTSLMLRPDYDGVHSKQVSFPGGRRELADENIRQTALREAHEEMNISPELVKVIGELSELYIPPSKSLVTPILAHAHKRPNFIPDLKEVSEIIEADLLNLLDDKSFGKIEIVRKSHTLKDVPAIFYNGFTIWGATAMMLNEMKWLLRDFKA